MNVQPLAIAGAFLINPVKRGDDRGAFARVYCHQEMAECGIDASWVQMNVSRNTEKGTVRGLHYQNSPHCEGKLVRCVVGEVLDVFVDLRAASPSYGKTCTVHLMSDNLDSVYIPPGCAHGFQTLQDNTELHYCHTAYYAPSSEGGVNPLDSDLNINWPLQITNISDRDTSHPSFRNIEPIHT